MNYTVRSWVFRGALKLLVHNKQEKIMRQVVNSKLPTFRNQQFKGEIMLLSFKN